MPDYARGAVEMGGREARYAYGRVDLNTDGTEEVLAILMGSIFFGTGGCNLLLLKEEGERYTVINTFPFAGSRSSSPIGRRRDGTTA